MFSPKPPEVSSDEVLAYILDDPVDGTINAGFAILPNGTTY